MQVVSSRWSLSLKLLMPSFWFCFFGGATIALFCMPLDNIQEPFTPMSARLIMLSFVVSSAAVYYMVFFSIKWVALDTEKIYVSNFFKSFQYSYESVKSVEETKFLIWSKVRIKFHESGAFGDNIVFFSSYFWNYYLKKNPVLIQQLLNGSKVLDNN